jgi:hypothetical protein
MRHSPGCKCGDCNPSLNDRIAGKSYAKGGLVTKTSLLPSRNSFYYAHPDEEDAPEPEPRMWGPGHKYQPTEDPENPPPGNYFRSDSGPDDPNDPDSGGFEEDKDI